MAKTGPMNKAEKFYVDQHHETIDIDTIARDLDRSRKAITNYIAKNKKELEEINADSYEAGDPMPKTNNPIVMTQAESEKADLLYRGGSRISNKMSKCITRTKNR